MMPDRAEPAGDMAPTSTPTTSLPQRLNPVRTATRLGVWGRARFILVGSSTHIVEFGGGLILLMWGVWLSLPLHTFASDPLLYRAMANLAPEWVWGFVSLIVGTSSLWVLLTDGRANRARMSMLQFIIWAFVCLFIGQSSGFRSTAVPIYAMLALGSAWVYVRLERDKRRPG